MHDRLAIVVIGRNEGQRLRACLESVRGERVIYVDSGSTDDSRALAESLGAKVIALDPPFSAARGRNAGLALADRMTPPPQFVQFVDGDCELNTGWLAAACECLDANPATAAVAGLLRERHPEASIYNRLCDLEWQALPGRTSAVGGVAMYRVASLAQTGPFDPDIAAGEEPELCLRLRTAGWTLRRIDLPMATHDAGLLRFAQWWRRVVRGGRGAADVYFYTQGKLFGSLVWRAFIWGFMLPLLGLAIAICSATLENGALARAMILSLAALYMLQMMRMAWHGLRRALALRDAVAFGALSVVSKFAEMFGLILHLKRSHRLRMAARAAQSAFPISNPRSI